MADSRCLRNVGIVAHVDAGKTTTTEHILFESGRIRSLGRVDDGTAHTDWLDVERERGISVRAATTAFGWKGCMVNLIDTPGHVDFAAEVERALRVLDGAVLIVSAAEGVQAHTEILWRALQALRIPTLIFMNKMDRIGADSSRVMREIRELLTPAAVPIQAVSGEGEQFVDPICVLDSGRLPGSDPDRTGDGSRLAEAVREEILDRLTELDDEVLEKYLAGETLPLETLKERLILQVRQAAMVPVLYGSAIKGIGIQALLDAMVDYLPAPAGDPAGPVSGVVFKLERHKAMGRVAYVRLYNGTLKNRDVVQNVSQSTEEKITQIRKIQAQSYEDVGVLQAGDIAAICGLSQVRIGDILGSRTDVPAEHRLSVPLLTVQVKPQNEADYTRLAAALQELTEEDPVLDLQWLQEERELHVKVMGTIQLEVLTSLLKSRFQLDVQFGHPSVIYKETPAKAAEGYVAYTMPKPCWAILRFYIEPGERGSGLVYSSQVRAEHLLPSYQNEVERRVPEALQQGLYGWEVTDLKVTLIEGEHHVWHTHPLDFVVATPMGIMDGLVQTGTTLLEPILAFRISVPEELGGKVLSDLVQMRAVFDSPVISAGRFAVEGEVPLATSLDYSIQLGILSGGRATWTTRFAGYRECPPGFEVSRARRGVDPRDRSKYILSVRNAIARE